MRKKMPQCILLGYVCLVATGIAGHFFVFYKTFVISVQCCRLQACNQAELLMSGRIVFVIVKTNVAEAWNLELIKYFN